MRLRLPFRLRLTLWFGILLVLVMIISALVLFFGLQWQLHRTFDDQLSTQSEIIMSELTFDGEVPSLSAMDWTNQEYIVRIVIPADVPTSNDSATTDRHALSQALEGRRVFSSIHRDDDDILRTLSQPIYAADSQQVVGVLVVGLDRADLDQTLSVLGIALVVLIPLAAAASLVGGYVLSERAVEPISHINRLARSIDEHDLDSRINLDLPDDELGQLADTFNSMLSRLEDAFARQRKFTGDAAHELRTPLTIMRNRIDLARSQPRTNDYFQHELDALSADLSRLTSLAQTLLSLSRLDNPDQRIAMETIDLRPSVEAAVEPGELLAESAGIDLSGDLRSLIVVANQELVTQVVLNILTNAIKYTPVGGKILISMRSEESNAVIIVKDTGSGIAPEHLPYLFDRFYTVDTARSRETGGVGLGLAICQQIMRIHHGSIGITSEPGQGTTVRLTFPQKNMSS